MSGSIRRECAALALSEQPDRSSPGPLGARGPVAQRCEAWAVNVTAARRQRRIWPCGACFSLLSSTYQHSCPAYRTSRRKVTYTLERRRKGPASPPRASVLARIVHLASSGSSQQARCSFSISSWQAQLSTPWRIRVRAGAVVVGRRIRGLVEGHRLCRAHAVWPDAEIKIWKLPTVL